VSENAVLRRKFEPKMDKVIREVVETMNEGVEEWVWYGRRLLHRCYTT
jgi:hypothetical protein